MSNELSDEAKMSYALGMDIGASFSRMPFSVNAEEVISGFRDVLGGKKPKISQEEFNSTMQAFQAMLRDAAQKQSQAISAENKKREAEFLAKNKTLEGVVTTASGLQYKVLKKGTGPKPAATNVVKVHYTGTLPNGTVFDSSVKRGEPAVFPLNQVIPGWTEALQLMNVGSKHLLYIPSALAYGPRGAGELIGPDQMLVFEVELLDIVK